MQKTADEMRMRDLIADVCASDLVSRASMIRMFANAGEPSDGISCHSANPPNRAMKLAIQPISATSNSFKTCRRSRTTRSGGTLGEMSPGIVSAEAPDIAFRVQRLIAASGIAVIVMRLADHHGAFVPGMEARSEEHTSELQSLMRIAY